MIDDSRRLDDIEALYLAMPDPSGVRLHAHISKRGPKEGCSCGKGKACEDGPPRWANNEGKPYALRTVQDWLAKVRGRLRARATVAREERRALNLARFDHAVGLAMAQKQTKDLIAATSRVAELDGSHVAAEEAQLPGVALRVRALAATLTDYAPSDAAPEAAPLPPDVVRFNLERLERLLLAADDASARYRGLGDPGSLTEAQRAITARRLNKYLVVSGAMEVVDLQ